jgi:Ca-activated chloride channel family protein
VVIDPSDAPAAAEKFRKYIQSPVLTNIGVSYAGFDAYDIEPVAAHDLFAERPVIVFGKWRGAAQGAITVSGTKRTLVCLSVSKLPCLELLVLLTGSS